MKNELNHIHIAALDLLTTEYRRLVDIMAENRSFEEIHGAPLSHAIKDLFFMGRAFQMTEPIRDGSQIRGWWIYYRRAA